eukprot:gene3730-4252_t
MDEVKSHSEGERKLPFTSYNFGKVGASKLYFYNQHGEKDVDEELMVETSGYSSYTRKQTSDKFNYFQIEFKTSQSTGLLMHAKGTSDFVTLELIKGKLRYAADFGKTLDSYGVWTSGYHEMYVGGNFAEDHWHRIVLVHNEMARKVYIRIDKHKESEYITARTIPPYSADFGIEYVHLGGMKGLSMLSERESKSRRGLKACFRNSTINGKSLIEGKDVTLIDAKKSQCLAAYNSPIDFPVKESYFSYMYDQPSMNLQFGFKTNFANQPLISYDGVFTVKLDISGKVILEFHTGDKTAVASGLHNGFWHWVKITIPDVQKSAKLEVNGQTSSISLSAALRSGQRLQFGKDFAGCLKNLIVNSKKIASADLEMFPKNLPSNQIPVFGVCSLAENCVPNPCMHGGKCQQGIGSFKCDCTNTGYQGAVCSQSLYSRTCDELRSKEKGKTKSGLKFLDMDGIGPLSRIQVYCEYESSGTETKVSSNLPKDVAVENQFGSKYIKIPYAADRRSIKSIVASSSACKQHVKYACTKSALFQSPTGPVKVRWVGSNDYFHYYWGGADGREMKCRCGVYNNCTDASKYCNCDARSSIETKDEGYLTVKKHLPMQQIEFLDVNSNDGSKGRFSIGPLVCSGDASKANAVSFRDSLAFLALKPTSGTDYNNAIQALTISFDFKTTSGEGTLLHGVGRTSPDFINIHMQSKTLLRAEVNLGSAVSFVDIDIASVNRVFDDDKFHSLQFEFNRKEVMLSVDHVRKVAAIDARASTHLNLDGESFTIGGGYGVSIGFLGCIQGLFINGELIDVASQAKFHEKYGVHAGCGIGCNRPSLSPCNNGKCIEKYTTFNCDCSLSSYDGKYCHKESYPLHFTSDDSLMYVFDKPVSVKEGRIMTAFKTDGQNGLIFSLRGDNQNCHITLVIQSGELKLLYNFDKASSAHETMQVAKLSGRTTFSDGKLYSLRIVHNEKRISFQLLDGKSKAQEQDIKSHNTILTAVKLSIASMAMPLLPQRGLPNSFNGCVSAFKYNYFSNMAAKPVSLDVLALYSEGKSSVTGKGTPGKCGKPLPTPPPLSDLLYRPTTTTFKTRPVPAANSITGNDLTIIVIIIGAVLALILILIIIFFCRHINRNLGAYKTHEDKRPLSADREMTQMSPPDSSDGKASNVPTDSAAQGDAKDGQKQEWYV